MDDLDFIKKNAGLTEDPTRTVAMPRESMDRILEAMEAGIYAIEHPNADQQFAVNALHSALSLIDPHHRYKE